MPAEPDPLERLIIASRGGGFVSAEVADAAYAHAFRRIRLLRSSLGLIASGDDVEGMRMTADAALSHDERSSTNV